MRDIKFRGIELYKQNFVYGCYLKDEKGTYIIDSENYDIPVDPATVGQFTGRTLKDGTEIYENEYVMVKGTKSVGVYQTKVVHKNFGFALEVNKTKFNDDVSLIAIIGIANTGTVHTHPELVK